jgi:hypothetical protein
VWSGWESTAEICSRSGRARMKQPCLRTQRVSGPRSGD